MSVASKIPVVKLCGCFGCSTPAVAKGLCDTHYRRLQKHGDVDATGRAADWGKREKHPLYKTWISLRRNVQSDLGAWYDDFWAMVAAVGERPSVAHLLIRLNTSKPYAADNAMWCESKAGPAKDEAHAGRRANQRNYMREYHQRRRAADPFIEHRSALRRVGLTPESYDAMLEMQGGVCAICRRTNSTVNPKNGMPIRMSVDHDHTTGSVRGLLCSPCNTSLGNFNDDVLLLESAIRYLQHPPAAPLALKHNGSRTKRRARDSL